MNGNHEGNGNGRNKTAQKNPTLNFHELLFTNYAVLNALSFVNANMFRNLQIICPHGWTPFYLLVLLTIAHIVALCFRKNSRIPPGGRTHGGIPW
jgi:hypothetical protein